MLVSNNCPPKSNVHFGALNLSEAAQKELVHNPRMAEFVKAVEKKVAHTTKYDVSMHFETDKFFNENWLTALVKKDKSAAYIGTITPVGRDGKVVHVEATRTLPEYHVGYDSFTFESEKAAEDAIEVFRRYDVRHLPSTMSESLNHYADMAVVLDKVV